MDCTILQFRRQIESQTFEFYNLKIVQNIIYFLDYRIQKPLKQRKKIHFFLCHCEGRNKNIKRRRNVAKFFFFIVVKGAGKIYKGKEK